MSRTESTDDQLRSQIASAIAREFPTAQIEETIAESLLENGRFEDYLDADQLALILRNLVYTSFAQYKLGGLDVRLVHNVPKMKVALNGDQANVNFLVHIHKPIKAFLNFKYALVNDPVSVDRRLRLKRGSLSIKEHTRRFDIKAKAALAAINLNSIAQKELSDLTLIIMTTLPPQLERHGLEGSVSNVELALVDRRLHVCLEGEFTLRSAG